jgi:D-arginine dehydrogenase
MVAMHDDRSVPHPNPHFDIAIVGAGIAGASVAWQLLQWAPALRLALLEREDQPGYHSTGRSAAMFMESYGPPQVRALTRASRAFYEQPPDGFVATPLLRPRPVLYVATPEQAALLDSTEAELRATGTAVQRLSAAQTLQRMPCLRAEPLLGALLEDGAADIDVHALHQGFLRGFTQAGGQLLCRFEVQQAEHDGSAWQLVSRQGSSVQATTVVNAAGAWADGLAALLGAAPQGLQPKRRSAFTFAAPAGVDVSDWPTVVNVAEQYYFKPDAGRLLGSPANADPVPPQDVQPEELDIAEGMARIEEATTLPVTRPLSTWAGLRTFAPDGELLVGPDPAVPGLFWLAGQGGYGIQSAAGTAQLAAAQLLGRGLPAALAEQGVDDTALRPGRMPQ